MPRRRDSRQHRDDETTRAAANSAGWDSGEEKEGGVHSAERGEEKMERQLKLGVGTAKISGRELGLNELNDEKVLKIRVK